MDEALATAAPPPAVRRALQRLGLLSADARFTPLTGGVASDIWRIDRPGLAPLCVKQARARLKVAADWRVPVERNAHEVAWMQAAAAIEPTAVPALRGHDAQAGLFVMDYLDPAAHPLWKDLLRQGVAEIATATAVAARLAHIHAATAGDADIAARFANDAIFHAIRLEPYLEAAARAHPDLADALQGLVATTAGNRRALVHGDVSPKNILVGPQGPVFLDAECATYGDPAFDLAFCLNHLLLKGLWVPASAGAFLKCFDAMVETYLARVDWEAPAAFEARAAQLLPGLLLARVDGKSPVEYLTAAADKDRVRRVASALLRRPADRLADVRGAWADDLDVT